MIDVFSYKDIAFPKGFLWGASTAGEQIEGNGKSYHDDPETAPKQLADGRPYTPPGLACNSYELWREDISLLEQMGLSLYRFSIEWSRIEPEEGVYDEAALRHYLDILESLKKKGIKVCLTLLHFAIPVWFYKKGHFNTMNNLGYWEKYLEYIVPRVAPYVDYWNIINELNLPFEYTLPQRLNLVRYHGLGYRIVKQYSKAPAGSAHSYSPKVPLRGNSDGFDRLMAQNEDWVCNEFFFHAIRTGEILAPYTDGVYDENVKDSCDYWALNTYVRHMIDGRKAYPLTGHYKASSFIPLDTPSHMDEILPEIMVDMLLRMRDKPCLITENGISTTDDRYRVVCLAAMLQGLHQAIELGATVWGYSHWSLLDNWEWGSFTQPFGLAAWDKETFARTLKPSGHFYGEIARGNALTQQSILQYLDKTPSLRDRNQAKGAAEC